MKKRKATLTDKKDKVQQFFSRDRRLCEQSLGKAAGMNVGRSESEISLKICAPFRSTSRSFTNASPGQKVNANSHNSTATKTKSNNHTTRKPNSSYSWHSDPGLQDYFSCLKSSFAIQSIPSNLTIVTFQIILSDIVSVFRGKSEVIDCIIHH